MVTIIVAYMILKKMKPQTVLFAGGFTLLACTILMGYPILDVKKSTGVSWFDIFKFIELTFSSSSGRNWSVDYVGKIGLPNIWNTLELIGCWSILQLNHCVLSGLLIYCWRLVILSDSCSIS